MGCPNFLQSKCRGYRLEESSGGVAIPKFVRGVVAQARRGCRPKAETELSYAVAGRGGRRVGRSVVGWEIVGWEIDGGDPTAATPKPRSFGLWVGNPRAVGCLPYGLQRQGAAS